MSDFFELPRPKPNANLETLDMKSLGLNDAAPILQSIPSPHLDQISQHLSSAEKPVKDEIIGFTENSQDEERSGGNADVQEVLQEISKTYNKNVENQEKMSNDDNDDKETHHESVAQEPTKNALQIIEENIQSLKKEEIQAQFIAQKQKNTIQIKKPLTTNSQLSKKIQNIIDFGENDLGEVGEWVEKTANCNKQDDDFEVKDDDFDEVFDDSKNKTENIPKSSKESNEDHSMRSKNNNNIERFGIGTATNKKSGGGYMMNNLKDKAKSMLLAQGVATAQNNQLKGTIEDDKKKDVVMIGNPEEEKKLVEEEKGDGFNHLNRVLGLNNEDIEHYTNHDWEEISKRNLEKLNSSNIRMHSEEDMY